MSDHLDKFSLELSKNRKIAVPFEESSKSRLAGKLRYWWGWVVVVSMVLFVAPPLIIFYRLRSNRDGFYRWCDWGGRTWFSACGVDVDVRGLENLEDGKQYVFISNHRSYLDTAALYIFAGRRLGIIGKKELVNIPIFGYGMGVANIIAIDRSNPAKSRESMDKARELMEKGFSFGVFAEGTRAYPGELLPFKKGAIHLALQTGAPIIPVAIKNTDYLMGKKTGVLRPGTLEMVLLPAIETEGKTAADDLMDLLIETRTAVAEELYRG